MNESLSSTSVTSAFVSMRCSAAIVRSSTCSRSSKIARRITPGFSLACSTKVCSFSMFEILVRAYKLTSTMQTEMLPANRTVWMEMIQHSNIRLHTAAMQGMRPHMEDATGMSYGTKTAVFGLFDGHGGDSVSIRASRELCPGIIRELDVQMRNHTGDFIAAAREACLISFKRFNDSVDDDWVGSCAVVALLGPMRAFGRRDLVVANLGDSRAVVVSGTSVTSLSTDHNSKNPSEVARIKDTPEAEITEDGRLKGILAITRSLGDKVIKHGLSAEPTFVCCGVKPGDLIMLFCDGMYERPIGIEPPSNMDIVRSFTKFHQRHAHVSNKQSPSAISLSMRDMMRDNCGLSHDNMSMGVIELGRNKETFTCRSVDLPNERATAVSPLLLKQLRDVGARFYYQQRAISIELVSRLKPCTLDVQIPDYPATKWKLI